LAGQNADRLCPTRDGGLDLAARSDGEKIAIEFWRSGIPLTSCREVLAGRKPLLALRFAGAFLLRLAERTFAY
jgi:hypothetical protein